MGKSINKQAVNTTQRTKGTYRNVAIHLHIRLNKIRYHSLILDTKYSM